MTYKALLIANWTFGPTSELPLLNGPRHDIDAMYDALTHEEFGLYDAADVKRCDDLPLTELTRTASTFLKSTSREDDVLVYYSGHGIKPGARLYLAASDTIKDEPESSALNTGNILDWLADATRAERVLFILDCCYAGSFDKGGDGATALEEALPGKWYLCSSTATQVSRDGDTGRPSPFTHALVTAIRDPTLTAAGFPDRLTLDVAKAHMATSMRPLPPPLLKQSAQDFPVIARRRAPAPVDAFAGLPELDQLSDDDVVVERRIEVGDEDPDLLRLLASLLDLAGRRDVGPGANDEVTGLVAGGWSRLSERFRRLGLDEALLREVNDVRGLSHLTRMRLDVDPELAHLPWEYMQLGQRTNGFDRGAVALRRNVLLERRVRPSRRQAPVRAVDEVALLGLHANEAAASTELAIRGDLARLGVTVTPEAPSTRITWEECFAVGRDGFAPVLVFMAALRRTYSAGSGPTVELQFGRVTPWIDGDEVCSLFADTTPPNTAPYRAIVIETFADDPAHDVVAATAQLAGMFADWGIGDVVFLSHPSGFKRYPAPADAQLATFVGYLVQSLRLGASVQHAVHAARLRMQTVFASPFERSFGVPGVYAPEFAARPAPEPPASGPPRPFPTRAAPPVKNPPAAHPAQPRSDPATRRGSADLQSPQPLPTEAHPTEAHPVRAPVSGARLGRVDVAMTAVRQARATLGAALATDGRPDQALEQYRAAVGEQGRTPPDAHLHFQIGSLQETLSDPGAALDSYLHALVDDVSSEAVAAAAARLLDAQPPARRWRSLGATLAARLRSSTAAASRSHDIAAALLRRSGDLTAAADVLDRALLGPVADRARLVGELVDTLLELGELERARQAAGAGRGSCDTGTEATVLLEEGRFEAAARCAAAAGNHEAEAVRILALVGLGRAREAVESVTEDAAPAATAARIAAHLAVYEYDEALELSEKLVETAGPDPVAVLVRAQVLFEAAGTEGRDPGFADVDEARRTLRRLGQYDPLVSADPARRLLRHPWLRQQRRVRDDDRFRYAWAEIVVALDHDVRRRRETVAHCTKAYTTVLQDAAISELAAMASDPHDDVAHAAETLHAAAVAVDGSEQPRRALAWAVRAADTRGTVEDRCTLLDIAWRASYAPDGDAAADRDALEAALARLSDPTERFGTEAGWRPASVVGLGLARAAELGRRTDEATAWEAVPYQLAAALASGQSYYWTHASLLLGRAGATAAAALFARRAVEIAPDDAWARDTDVIATANHLADERLVAQVLAGYADADSPQSRVWSEAVRYYVTVLNGHQRETAPPAELPVDLWARWTVLVSRILIDGTTPHTAELETLAAELEAAEPDLEMQTSVYLCLGRLADVDRLLERAERDGLVEPRVLTELHATARLRRGDDDAAEAALAGLWDGETTPARLRAALNVELPVLALLAPARQPAVTRLAAVAERRLAELLAHPPAVAADVDHAPAGASYRELTRRLIGLAERQARADGVGLARAVDALAEIDVDGVLEPAVHAVRTAFAEVAAVLVLTSLIDDAVVDTGEALAAVELTRRHGAGAAAIRNGLAGWVFAAGADVPARLEQVRHVSGPGVVEQVVATGVAACAAEGDEVGARRALEAGVAAAVGSVGRGEEAGFGAAVDTIDTFRRADGLLRQLADDDAWAADPRALATDARAALAGRLDDLFRLGPARVDDVASPVTPIMVELAEDLVPLVDPAVAGPRFFDELVPEIKRRVWETAGVRLPGLRFRPRPGLVGRSLTVEIDGVLVGRAEVPPVDGFRTVAVGSGPPRPDLPVTRYHPRTGRRGRWQVVPVDVTAEPGADPGAEPGPEPGAEPADLDTLGASEYLLYVVEQVLRAHLADFVGLDEVTALLAERLADPDLLDVPAPRLDTRRLTWVLQQVLHEGLPIADWGAVVAAVSDPAVSGPAVSGPAVSGPAVSDPTTGLSQLADEVCDRLATRFADGSHRGEPAGTDGSDGSDGSEDGEPQLDVPAEWQTALVGVDPVRRHEFLGWLTGVVAEHGAVVTLVSGAPAARRAAALLARTLYDQVVTVGRDGSTP